MRVGALQLALDYTRAARSIAVTQCSTVMLAGGVFLSANFVALGSGQDLDLRGRV